VIKLGANILSQVVQRHLGGATAELSKVSERLASGQRINKASDDAAGLAISMSLNADSRIFSQGIRNLNDGISANSIAEGAMTQLGNIVERIEELATQSMNGTFSDVQRASMQKEVAAIQSEWNRIVESTTFNGTNLLTGESTRIVLQGGKGDSGTLTIQIGEEGIAGAAEGAAGRLSTVSIRSDGANTGNGASDNVSMSADGRYVVFDSTSTNLVIGDANGNKDIFLRDTLTGVTQILTQGGNGDSSNPVMSANGRYVTYQSAASNLVAGDTNTRTDIFVTDILMGTTERVSITSSAQESNGNASNAAISADGRYVVFQTPGNNLVSNDTNGNVDVFMRDRQAGTTVRISQIGSTEGNGLSGYASISADGRYISFGSQATTLLASDTDATTDMYIKDILTGSLTLASVSSSGQKGTGTNTQGRLSADGRYLSFHSNAANLVTGDANGFTDVFVRDLQSDTTILASVSSSESQGNGNSLQSVISADGRYVAFYTSATNLSDGADTNGTADVLIRDTVRGTTERASLKTDGTQGTNAFTGTIGSLSADGRFLAFTSTGTQFATPDVNGASSDVFLKDLTRTGVNQMSGMLVSNRVSAGQTLDLVQSYRNEILDYRAKLGASSSRISSFLSTLQSADINYQAASSRITDADVASEAANAVRLNILQRAATSLLAQANQAPQVALSLLNN
jgi:flagellin-like hook-associated protein FlgL